MALISCPTLKSICLNTLSKHTSRLGNLGWLETRDACVLLQYCATGEELASIEDATMEQSGRDLSWHTWHIWAKLYLNKYGPPVPNSGVELEPLPGEPPLDYEQPVTHAKQGDWRALYEAKAADIEARMAALKGRLRGSYAVEQHMKKSSAARATDKLPPAKRQRLGGAVMCGRGPHAAAAAVAERKIMGKAKSTVLKDLLSAKRSQPHQQQHRAVQSVQLGAHSKPRLQQELQQKIERQQEKRAQQEVLQHYLQQKQGQQPQQRQQQGKQPQQRQQQGKQQRTSAALNTKAHSLSSTSISPRFSSGSSSMSSLLDRPITLSPPPHPTKSAPHSSASRPQQAGTGAKSSASVGTRQLASDRPTKAKPLAKSGQGIGILDKPLSLRK